MSRSGSWLLLVCGSDGGGGGGGVDRHRRV